LEREINDKEHEEMWWEVWRERRKQFRRGRSLNFDGKGHRETEWQTKQIPRKGQNGCEENRG
jgi:hypothetical protein